jgi:hypothetical protein
MSEITRELIDGKFGKAPLEAYPWKEYADRLIYWAKERSYAHRAFAFDVLMSLAYVDTIPNIQKNFKIFKDLPQPYNVHFGFINLCAPLLLSKQAWHFQKAAKPLSGVIGKLTSEIILRFVEIIFDDFITVKSIGGVGIVDAVLRHRDGRIILCEIKASPLTTFPFLFELDLNMQTNLDQLTRIQVGSLNSCLYMHNDNLLSLGKVNDHLWPFAPAVDYLVKSENSHIVDAYVDTWESIRTAYRNKNRDNLLYYVANASGNPPNIAREKFGWPAKESISDSKTSAGLDRTDDIKKGIYQAFKLSIESSKAFPEENIKTALISNLPAYRHGEDYITPFSSVYWAEESSFIADNDDRYSCAKQSLKRPFDYIIALDDAFMRGEVL